MLTQTPNQRLASHLLGQPVVDWIRERRPHVSWRLIARELYEATSGEIDITPQTVITWAGLGDEQIRASA